MSQAFSFEIVTPAGLSFQAEVYEALLPTAEGEIGVLANHTPLTALIVPGVIRIRRHEGDVDATMEQLACAGGFVDIDGQRVRLLADAAERSDELDEKQVADALARAEKLKTEAKDSKSLEEALREVQQQRARLKVAELKRHKRNTA